VRGNGFEANFRGVANSGLHETATFLTILVLPRQTGRTAPYKW